MFINTISFVGICIVPLFILNYSKLYVNIRHVTNKVMHAFVENFYLLQFNVERKSIAIWSDCPRVIVVII